MHMGLPPIPQLWAHSSFIDALDDRLDRIDRAFGRHGVRQRGIRTFPIPFVEIEKRLLFRMRPCAVSEVLLPICVVYNRNIDVPLVWACLACVWSPLHTQDLWLHATRCHSQRALANACYPRTSEECTPEKMLKLATGAQKCGCCAPSV